MQLYLCLILVIKQDEVIGLLALLCTMSVEYQAVWTYTIRCLKLNFFNCYWQIDF